MMTPTPEQMAVLLNPNNTRIRIVRAAPGSGKTTLIGMIIRKEMEEIPLSRNAIAALSFTRVGGHEIRRELGYDLGHPHFVGTLDSFLYRFVVRPFLQKVNPDWAAPRLIPSEWSPSEWRNRPNGNPWTFHSSRTEANYNLFQVNFVGEDDTGPSLAVSGSNRGVIAVAAIDRADVVKEKTRCWKKYGWLTHADSAYLACEILGEKNVGQVVRSLVLRRFPFIIVDELQDTGYFLAKSVRILLAEPASRGVLVGDPNQAIYEFNGAVPSLFSSFEGLDGSERFPLGRSRRCQPSIVAAASHLKESADVFSGTESQGSGAFLVRYTEMSTDVPRLAMAIRNSRPSARIKIIARHSSTVELLSVGKGDDAQSLYCPAVSRYRPTRNMSERLTVAG